MKFPKLLACGLPLLGAQAMAADLSVKFELPQLNVAEYHRPYVAMWVERADQSFVSNLSVLYDLKKRDDGGTKYLKDLRQWWRVSGRDLHLPVDGVSGATRGAGQHTLAFPAAKAVLDKLPAGQYHVVVEVAREGGGRELLRLPFQLPVKAAQSVTLKGKAELVAASLELKP